MPTSTLMQQNEPLCIKLLVLGIASVGKSSLLLRLTDQQWLPEGERIPTIGVDTLVKLLACVDGRMNWLAHTCLFPGSQIRCERKTSCPEYLGA